LIEFLFLLNFAYYTSNNHRYEYIEFLSKKFKKLGFGAYEKIPLQFCRNMEMKIWLYDTQRGSLQIMKGKLPQI